MGFGGGTLSRLLKRTFERCGIYISRSPRPNSLDTHLRQLFSVLGVNCVLDVGAHHGEYGLELRQMGYRGRIVSFEPISDNFAALRQQLVRDPNWWVHCLALGDQEQTAEIKVMSGTTFGSFLAPSPYGLSQFPTKMQVERLESVTVRRLDNLFAECVAGIAEPRVFLKVDTQGYDQKVLTGAGAYLERVVGLQTEMSTKSIYEGMANAFVEALPALQARGFELTGIFPVTRDRKDTLRLIEVDCVLCRPPQRDSEETRGSRLAGRAQGGC